MKLKFLLFYLLIITIPITANATGGGLRKNTLKTCPNGITYGMHSDGQGGTHWHVAITNGENYYADGEAIYNDPCPDYNKNEGTAGSTNGNGPSNYKNNNKSQNSITSVKPIEKEKSKDNTIKKIIIDNKEIKVSDTMNYETDKKNISIEIETNDSKAEVDYENKELEFGENIINIIVTAENGEKKDYVLIINKIKGVGTATLKKFTIGAEDVIFENNKSIIKKLKNESTLDYSYELSDKNAKLEVYLNEKEVIELKSLKENDIIKLVVIDDNDNENIYEVTVKDAPIIYTIIIYGFSSLIMLTPVIGIIIAIIVEKKKKNKKEELK